MRPSFNTTGPCYPGEHYMLPPERRLGGVIELATPTRPWLFLREASHDGKRIRLVGC